MKTIIFLTLLCFSCASTDKPVVVTPVDTRPPCPAVSFCSDQLVLMDEDTLKKGTTCPANSKIVFPSYYGQGKILVLCQCK